jgi:hypothetical protein
MRWDRLNLKGSPSTRCLDLSPTIVSGRRFTAI